ncbi:MAG: hypothetical protein HQL05_07625 [Nitrospirae bacterium]|uniref:hypothetical protein n=1 Tax=Candidatus Magnetobacterium casense TaxID=1455061 RepID=UPI0012DF4364|nr:hypothetical protein [Candidatus Magnetobacterium casensis]MBF0337688.1 hypothetical protein [Nitrospirota bacterium]
MAKCVVCNSRKGKRNCPSFGVLICSQCCGDKKGGEVDCPHDCFFFSASKQCFTDKQTFNEAKNFERELNSIIGNEYDYLDVLQNIEFCIVSTYKKNRKLVDKDAQAALEYLLEMGKAHITGVSSKYLTKLSPIVRDLVEYINDIIEFREAHGKRESLMDRLKCIYRVLLSVKDHHNPMDDRSYLNFIVEYVR